MKTFSTKKTDFTRDWIVVDAKDMPLGRVASQIAARLRGKHKPIYTPGLDCGDFVVVINADKIVLTGQKHTDKIYNWYTGYAGGNKVARFDQCEYRFSGSIKCFKYNDGRWCRCGDD